MKIVSTSSKHKKRLDEKHPDAVGQCGGGQSVGICSPFRTRDTAEDNF